MSEIGDDLILPTMDHSSLQNSSHNSSLPKIHTSNPSLLRAMIKESERMLKLEWVQKKLEKRWKKVLEGKNEPFSL